VNKIWSDIQLIYDHFPFRSRNVISDLFIISSDNFYLLYWSPVGANQISIKIEKNYNLVGMWSLDDEESCSYHIKVDCDGIEELDVEKKISIVTKILSPFLREVKLNKVLQND
jgi:hypothetical protein